MESFSCLIQTHTGQEEESGWSERPRGKERERENTQSTRKIEITETGRQRRENEGEWAGKDCFPWLSLHPTATIACLYLSKESSLLAQELKPLSHRAGVSCPRVSASFSCWRLQGFDWPQLSWTSQHETTGRLQSCRMLAATGGRI